MKILIEVLTELFSMFMADARLAIEIMILVILVGALLHFGFAGLFLPGLLLLVGCLGILTEAVLREARKRRKM